MDFSKILNRRFGLGSHNQINIKPMVDSSINAFENGNIALLQNELFQLVSNFNKPGCGKLITGFAEKDRLAECFTLCLQYDWMNDSDIREVWAENGFYCIVDYLTSHWNNKQDLIAASLNLFLLLHQGKESLKPKIKLRLCVTVIKEKELIKYPKLLFRLCKIKLIKHQKREEREYLSK